MLHPFVPANTEDSAGSHSEFKRKELRADAQNITEPRPLPSANPTEKHAAKNK